MTPLQLTEWFHTPLADRVVLTLAHVLWQGTLVALAVVVAGSLCGQSVNRRYAVSVLGLLALVICPLVTFSVVGDEGQVAATAPVVSIDRYDGLPRPSNEGGEIVGDGLGRSSSKSDLLSSATPWLLMAWVSGVVMLFTRLLLGVISVAWLKSTGEIAGEMLREQAKSLSRRLKMKTPIVHVSRQVTQALAVGFFRPVIVIPTAWLIQLPPECLEAVLAHELAHIRRRDLWVNLLQRMVETFLFFHPAVWWLSARLRQEREMCCDELAVSLTGRRVEYASTLELVARRQGATVAPALAAGLGGGRMALLNRVRNVLGLSPEGSGISPWTLGAAALVAGAGVGWLVTGGSPLSALANDEEEVLVVAQADGDREEGERERPRDGDRPRDGEGDRPRDGDRPREGGPRDGDRPQEGDRPGPDEFRRHIEQMKGRVRALVEQGRREEAEGLEREIRAAVERFERGPRPDGPRPEGDRPRPEIHPELRAHLEQLHRQMREAAEAGRRDEAQELENKIHAIHERIRAQHEGERPRPDGEREGPRVEGDRPRPEFAPRDRELMEVIQALREEVGRLRAEVNQLKGGREGADRPREGADRPREGADRPREGADRPREGADRPREGAERPRDGADRPREGADRPRERDVPRDGGDRPREGGDRE